MPSEEAKKIFQFEAAAIIKELADILQNLRPDEHDKIELISQKARTLKSSAEQFEFPGISSKAEEIANILKDAYTEKGQFDPARLNHLKEIIKDIDSECQRLKS